MTDATVGAAEPAPTSSPMAITLLGEALFTLRGAVVGFIAGVISGLAVAIMLARSKFLERGLTPYIIASQIIPLTDIAIEALANLKADGLDVTGAGYSPTTVELTEGGN